MTHKTISYKKPNIVAEIGCNHKGDIDIAKELIGDIIWLIYLDMVR